MRFENHYSGFSPVANGKCWYATNSPCEEWHNKKYEKGMTRTLRNRITLWVQGLKGIQQRPINKSGHVIHCQTGFLARLLVVNDTRSCNGDIWTLPCKSLYKAKCSTIWEKSQDMHQNVRHPSRSTRSAFGFAHIFGARCAPLLCKHNQVLHECAKKNANFFKKWSLYPRKVIVKFGIYPRLGETTIL